MIKEPIENVVITSQNGVEALLSSFSPDELKFKNIYCVGRRTKKLIEQKIGKVQKATKNAVKLAEHLSTALENKEVTYFCSDIRLDVLPNLLALKGITVNEVEAYKTMLSPVALTDTFDGVLFYSPSTIESYLQENTTDKIAFCIGETTAKKAREHFENVQVANLPSVESVIATVNTHFIEQE